MSKCATFKMNLFTGYSIELYQDHSFHNCIGGMNGLNALRNAVISNQYVIPKIAELKVPKGTVVVLDAVPCIGDPVTSGCSGEELPTQFYLPSPFVSIAQPDKTHSHHPIDTGSEHGDDRNILMLAVNSQLGSHDSVSRIE